MDRHLSRTAETRQPIRTFRPSDLQTRGTAMVSEAPAANWMGQPVPIESVERELGRLRGEGARWTPRGEPVLATRTNVLNLIVHAATLQEVEHVAGLIERLGMHP